MKQNQWVGFVVFVAVIDSFFFNGHVIVSLFFAELFPRRSCLERYVCSISWKSLQTFSCYIKNKSKRKQIQSLQRFSFYFPPLSPSTIDGFYIFIAWSTMLVAHRLFFFFFNESTVRIWVWVRHILNTQIWTINSMFSANLISTEFLSIWFMLLSFLFYLAFSFKKKKNFWSLWSVNACKTHHFFIAQHNTPNFSVFQFSISSLTTFLCPL